MSHKQSWPALSRVGKSYNVIDKPPEGRAEAITAAVVSASAGKVGRSLVVVKGTVSRHQIQNVGGRHADRKFNWRRRVGRCADADMRKRMGIR
jgi:hypothetical protein